ncbi:hypothetical protein SAMN05421768_102490 [Chryseobacterium joostei]|uniref:Uncharacterized protein n=1 Tax=Chryseobacterium joostei TaxID=112234 RepID=A0A1N7I3I3_9FLAO|nr:hypothetical protein SAMN05421768_102490 [Chryseobacterium joostei]
MKYNNGFLFYMKKKLIKTTNKNYFILFDKQFQ